jgi:hypothetical protein
MCDRRHGEGYQPELYWSEINDRILEEGREQT